MGRNQIHNYTGRVTQSSNNETRPTEYLWDANIAICWYLNFLFLVEAKLIYNEITIQPDTLWEASYFGQLS